MKKSSILLVLTFYCLNSFGISSIEDVREFVKTNPNLEDVGFFIENLSEDLRKNFTLVKDSKSLQEASSENPRAILFGSKANFILTFNGDQNQKGYDVVEMMEFTPNNEFELYELEFIKGKGLHLSDKNPAKCTRCHQRSPRPIWDMYARWPGVYGENDDKVDIVREKYNQKLRYWLGHKRYGHLFFDNSNPAAPFHSIEIDSHISGYDVEPNLRLTALLAIYQAQSVFKRIKEHPNFEGNKLNFGRSLFSCWTNGEPRFFDYLANFDIDPSRDWTLQNNVNNSFVYGYNGGHTAFVIDLVRLNYVDYMTQINHDWKRHQKYKDLTYDFSKNSPSYSHAKIVTEMKGVGLKPEVKKEVCNREDIKETRVSRVSDEVRLSHALRYCADCHSTSNIAPYIPFEDRFELIKYLARSENLIKMLNQLQNFGSKPQKMPPAGIHPSTHRTLINFIRRPD